MTYQCNFTEPNEIDRGNWDLLDETWKCEHIAVTPYGVPLKANLVGKKYKGYGFTKMGRVVNRCLDHGVKPNGPLEHGKDYLPNLKTSTRDYTLVVLDIDGENYTQAIENHLIELAMEGRITAARSASSGRVKGFLLVRHICTMPSRHNLLATVRSQFGYLADLIDHSGMTSTFINRSVLSEIRLAMQLEPVEMVVEKRSQLPMKRQELGEVATRLLRQVDVDCHEFVTALMSWVKRGCSGTLQIPQEYWASNLKVSQSTISRWIKLLIEMGFLECTNEKYVPGKDAKTYGFSGELKIIASMVTPLNSLPPVKYLVCTVKKMIDVPGTGEWWSYTEKLVKACWSGEVFMEIFSGITGFNKKGRLQRAKAYWNFKATRLGLSTI